MIDRSKLFDGVFIEPGIVRVSEAALQLAQEFATASGAGPDGRRVATFDWAQSITISDHAGAPEQEVGPCFILGAYEREDVPPDCIARVGQFQYAIRMPRDVLAPGGERMIDGDTSAPFGLVFC